MAISNSMHIIPICEELQRIFDVELKTALNLKTVLIGDIGFLPTTSIADMVNSVIITPAPSTTIEPSELPKQLLQTHNFRIVYLRRMALGENVVKKSMEDGTLIINTLFDKIHLPDITNIPSTGQILWVMPRSVEWNPPEDSYVSRLSAEISAIAINLEVVAKARRG